MWTSQVNRALRAASCPGSGGPTMTTGACVSPPWPAVHLKNHQRWVGAPGVGRSTWPGPVPLSPVSSLQDPASSEMTVTPTGLSPVRQVSLSPQPGGRTPGEPLCTNGRASCPLRGLAPHRAGPRGSICVGGSRWAFPPSALCRQLERHGVTSKWCGFQEGLLVQHHPGYQPTARAVLAEVARRRGDFPKVTQRLAG